MPCKGVDIHAPVLAFGRTCARWAPGCLSPPYVGRGGTGGHWFAEKWVREAQWGVERDFKGVVGGLNPGVRLPLAGLRPGPGGEALFQTCCPCLFPPTPQPSGLW